ncbi:MAG: LuxR C-terminal-related transcriptional regulator [Bacteroidales bacterium]
MEEANRDFFIRLKEKFPDLSEKEKRLAAYIRLNLSTKDVASLLNIAPKSVEINRYRLRKKLGIDPGINLTEFILEI